MTLVLRYAARSDRGLVRANNEDSVYAGARLLALADGMGGHAAGEVASQLVIAALAHLDDDEPGGDLLSQARRRGPRGQLGDRRARRGRPRTRGHGHHADRNPVRRQQTWAGAHRRLSRLSAPRRGAGADHQGRHLRPDAGRRGPHHRRGGAQPPAALADHAGAHRPRGRAHTDHAGGPCRRPLPVVLRRAVRSGQSRNDSGRAADSGCGRKCRPPHRTRAARRRAGQRHRGRRRRHRLRLRADPADPRRRGVR